METVFTVKELAAQWKTSEDTISRMFRDEPGILRVSSLPSNKRKYQHIRIPLSVAQRKWREMEVPR